jgi:hypothetical protein
MPWFLSLVGRRLRLINYYYLEVRKYPHRLEEDELKAEKTVVVTSPSFSFFYF